MIMLDLETLDVVPSAHILAIGAVKFDEQRIFSEFFATIAVNIADTRFTLSKDTQTWWLEEQSSVLELLDSNKPHTQLGDALELFELWMDGDTEVWGNGAAFDNVVLAHAFRQYGKPVPWNFWQDRCYRTTRNMYPEVKFERVGTYHHPLDDARSQAEHLIKIMKYHNSWYNKILRRFRWSF